MKPVNITKGSIVRVQWVDSCSAYGWQQSTVSNAVEAVSWGIVVNCDKTDLSITHTIMIGHDSWLSPVSIPWVAITSVTTFKNKKEKVKSE